MTQSVSPSRIHRVSIASSLIVGLGLASICTEVFAANNEWIDGGKEIFRREWTHDAPKQVVEVENHSKRDSQSQAVNMAGDGLGPMFNATSCEACHARGGGGGVDRNVTLLTLDPRSEALDARSINNRFARRELIDLYPGLLSASGMLSMDVVLHEQSARPFYDPIRQRIGNYVADGAPQAWFVSKQRTVDAIANRPVLAGRFGVIDYYLSQRNSPPLFGLGTIDAIDQSKLNEIAVRQSKRTGGRVTGRVGIGLFGWRAQTKFLEQFIRNACAGELGLQVAGSPQPADVADETYVSPGVDLNEIEVIKLVNYVRSLPDPVQEVDSPEHALIAGEGKRLFTKIGCAICHIQQMPPANEVYSDFLLHDMGRLLQAPSPAPTTLANLPRKRIPMFPKENSPFRHPSFRRGQSQPFGEPSGSYHGIDIFGSGGMPVPFQLAKPEMPKFPRGRVPKSVLETRDVSEVTWDMLQREWRTPPLWGVADSAPYLHDGRAMTLDSAIRWHGGEASDAATAYRTLTKESREKVIAFLASLRSPPNTPRQESKLVVEPAET